MSAGWYENGRYVTHGMKVCTAVAESLNNDKGNEEKIMSDWNDGFDAGQNWTLAMVRDFCKMDFEDVQSLIKYIRMTKEVERKVDEQLKGFN